MDCQELYVKCGDKFFKTGRERAMFRVQTGKLHKNDFKSTVGFKVLPIFPKNIIS